MNLYNKHRPPALAWVVGQEKAVSQFEAFFKRANVPHAILLHGPSGCGKTTLARIIRRQLECSTEDYFEINCADFKGIDTIREIRARMRSAPFFGKVKMWVIDECFPAGTLVQSPNGLKRIESFSPGDAIFNLDGVSTVRNVFKNRVALRRVAKIHFDNGDSIVTSNGHEFLTTQGWVAAEHLQKGDCIFRNTCHPMGNENLRILPDPVHPQIKKKEPTNLLQTVQHATKKQRKWTQTNGDWRVCVVLQNNLLCLAHPTDILLHCLLQKTLPIQSQEQIQTTQSYGLEEDFRFSERILQNNKRKRAGAEAFHAATTAQHLHTGVCRQSQTNQEAQRGSPYLERRARGKWEADGSAIDAGREIGTRMENRAGYTHGHPKMDRFPSHLLQGGSGIGETQSGDRGRWEVAQVEKGYNARCQKNENAGQLRVARVEIYEPGSNDEHFQGVFSDLDRDRGYVEFYDLEVTSHPSYFVQGIPVHNCHKLTGDAQSAILKLLEDTPPHVYFVLCTTDPQKISKPIHTRCTAVKLDAVAYSAMKDLILTVAQKEKMALTEKVVDTIIDCAEGSPRKALVLLEQVGNLRNEESMLEGLEKAAQVKDQAILLARALINPSCQWQEVASILKDLQDEPESIRYMILGYARSVLLSGGKLAPRAYLIIDCFSRNFYDSKQAGLAAACWEVVYAK